MTQDRSNAESRRACESVPALIASRTGAGRRSAIAVTRALMAYLWPCRRPASLSSCTAVRLCNLGALGLLAPFLGARAGSVLDDVAF